MKTIKFECRLLSDVIINQKAATEGANATLDFIPGNVFLGIVASHYDELGDKALEVFHSGRVRFGDAHPVGECRNDVRSLRVPAAMFYPKLKGLSGGCYISHLYHREDDSVNGTPQQLKQCRNGFYVFTENKGARAITEKSFAIKSAYDRSNRRSRDNMMFGYESLDAGLRFLFEVQVDDDSLAEQVSRMLTGVHYVGRSRTAQYGQVEISLCRYDDIPSEQKLLTLADGKKYATVYADGRLIFIDEDGEPTFTPTAHDLGIVYGEIEWSLSQVRTFGYAPWNGKRSTRDAERCGIEKGSVFVVRIDEEQNFTSQYVGAFRNEGFGKVIYNPSFLDSDGNNGKARYHLQDNLCDSALSNKLCLLGGTPLLEYINRRQKDAVVDKYVYEKVNEFVNKNRSKFVGERFASQWGSIRSIAMKERTYDHIMVALFNKEKKVKRTLDNKETKEPDAYLTHGVAAERWKKNGRRDALKRFMNDIHSEDNVRRYGDITAKALVNLAAEMAKKSK